MVYIIGLTVNLIPEYSELDLQLWYNFVPFAFFITNQSMYIYLRQLRYSHGTTIYQ